MSANSAKGSKENLPKEVIFKLSTEVYQVGMNEKRAFLVEKFIECKGENKSFGAFRKRHFDIAGEPGGRGGATWKGERHRWC